MAHFQTSSEFNVACSTLFELLVQPSQLERISPQDVNLCLVSGPRRMELGSVVTWKAKRSGIAQQMTVEVVEFEVNQVVVIKQQKGPFRKWVHRQELHESDDGIVLKDEIEFEPPGGLLGLVVTEDWVRDDLKKNFAFRNEKLRDILV